MYVICYEEAAIAIKNMSPDLMVLPILPLEEYEQRCKFEQWVKLAPALTIGSGLGRDPKLLDRFEYILDSIKDKIVIGDGDFFWYLSHDPEKSRKYLKNIKRLILTPNTSELKRLFKTVTNKELDYDRIRSSIEDIHSPSSDVVEVDIKKLAPELMCLFDYFDAKNTSFVIKGSADLILSEARCFVVSNKSSLKRCGGQGDILSGLATLYALWAENQKTDIEVGLAMASYINRRASFSAFKKKKLGMVAEDMLSEVTEAINEFLDDNSLLFDDSSQEFTKV